MNRIWQARATFAIDASGEQEANHILGDVLDMMDITPAYPHAFTQADERLWIAIVDIDLSGLAVIEPDTPKTRAAYVVRRATGGTWHVLSPRENMLIYEWPPSLWLTEAQPRGMLHSAIRGILVQISYEEAES
jgi:hypothetical protein